ncbi:hypothetical protein CHARACLAT_033350 [Characodon lateralis]|uniref:AGC-kinase C-terminal domain-containing protein n=1 Tax=Characodon lateralis TaxID=208331 RepID=A0ABU7EZG1_9TELE|nr:hypothetical protein [Characodon lateralis]
MVLALGDEWKENFTKNCSAGKQKKTKTNSALKPNQHDHYQCFDTCCLSVSPWSPHWSSEEKNCLRYMLMTHVNGFVFPQLEKKEMTPPFKPQISDEYGLDNFDTQFTNEPVQLTPDDE